MTTVFIVLTVVLSIAFGAAGVAKVLRLPKMRKFAEDTDFSVNSYVVIGVLEIAAVAGLLLGFVLRPLAVAAAIGLTLLMVGAVTALARAGRESKEWAPAIVLGILSAVVVWLGLTV